MNIFRTPLLFIVVVACLFSIASGASAVSFTISAADQGAFEDSGLHYYWSTNYVAGNDRGNREFRSFYVFDLASLAGYTITSATLTLFLPSTGYNSPDLSETYTLYDALSTDILDLQGDSGTITDPSIFDDLGTGDSYGAAEISNSLEGSSIDIVLGSEALFDLNSALGRSFAIGAAVTSLDYEGLSIQEVVFVNSQEVSLAETFLTLEAETAPVPEPSTVLLLGSGLFGLVGFRKKHKR